MGRDISIITCKKCGNAFRFSLFPVDYPDPENYAQIYCPYCGEVNAALRTNAIAISKKIPDIQEDHIPFNHKK